MPKPKLQINVKIAQRLQEKKWVTLSGLNKKGRAG